jgi:ADP-ribose pyrophosphatase YjhB (NUDIX family)
MKHRIRCGALMVQGNDLVIGEHWGPPAGGLDGAESIYDCTQREFFEETGATVSGLSLAYVTQYIDQKNQWNQVSFLFLAQTIEGTPKAQSEWGKSNEWIEDIVWLGEDELEGKFVIPPFIKDRFFEDLRNGIDSPIYVPAEYPIDS